MELVITVALVALDKIQTLQDQMSSVAAEAVVVFMLLVPVAQEAAAQVVVAQEVLMPLTEML
jgi:hypothetical protein